METKIRILAADPNQEFCRQLTELCAAEGDMEIVGSCADGLDALTKTAQGKRNRFFGGGFSIRIAMWRLIICFLYRTEQACTFGSEISRRTSKSI